MTNPSNSSQPDIDTDKIESELKKLEGKILSSVKAINKSIKEQLQQVNQNVEEVLKSNSGKLKNFKESLSSKLTSIHQEQVKVKTEFGEINKTSTSYYTHAIESQKEYYEHAIGYEKELQKEQEKSKRITDEHKKAFKDLGSAIAKMADSAFNLKKAFEVSSEITDANQIANLTNNSVRDVVTFRNTARFSKVSDADSMSAYKDLSDLNDKMTKGDKSLKDNEQYQSLLKLSELSGNKQLVAQKNEKGEKYSTNDRYKMLLEALQKLEKEKPEKKEEIHELKRKIAGDDAAKFDMLNDPTKTLQHMQHEGQTNAKIVAAAAPEAKEMFDDKTTESNDKDALDARAMQKMEPVITSLSAKLSELMQKYNEQLATVMAIGAFGLALGKVVPMLILFGKSLKAASEIAIGRSLGDVFSGKGGKKKGRRGKKKSGKPKGDDKSKKDDKPKDKTSREDSKSSKGSRKTKKTNIPTIDEAPKKKGLFRSIKSAGSWVAGKATSAGALMASKAGNIVSKLPGGQKAITLAGKAASATGTAISTASAVTEKKKLVWCDKKCRCFCGFKSWECCF